MKLKIKKLHPDARVPTYGSAGAACFDLYALAVNGAYTIGAHVYDCYPAMCNTGLAFEIPEGYVMLVFSRSGHGFNEDVRLANCVGVIDSDYRGEINVKLTCDRADEGDKLPFYVSPGDRIAQAMLMPVEQCVFEVVAELQQTERGERGLGSTGK